MGKTKEVVVAQKCIIEIGSARVIRSLSIKRILKSGYISVRGNGFAVHFVYCRDYVFELGVAHVMRCGVCQSACQK